MDNSKIHALRQAMQAEVENNILKYWMENTVDNENGGFYGSIDFNGIIDKKATKGAVLNSRILWTFSKAYNMLKNHAYLQMATRAFEYLDTYFRDKEFNGIYWELDHTGAPKNTQKYCYTQGFWIYGLSEYYKATGNKKALQQAMDIFEVLEDKALDKLKNGYIEAFARNWERTSDLRISAKDLNETKTYNTHLHILEAYAALYRVTANEKVGNALENLIYIVIEKFYNPENGHFKLFFNDDWEVAGDLISYGHDIEGAWLLWDAVISLGKDVLKAKALPVVMHIAEVCAAESIDSDGGQYYEGNTAGVFDTDKHWWPQAEAVVGFINAWQLSGNEKYFELAANSWKFIESYIVDKEKGEWLWKTDKNHVADTSQVRAGFWKCPYHNSRACFEIMDRLK